MLDEEREQHNREQEKARSEEQKREANCALAKTNLENINNSSYLYQKTSDPDNPRVLSEKERTTATNRAKEDVTRWCD